MNKRESRPGRRLAPAGALAVGLSICLWSVIDAGVAAAERLGFPETFTLRIISYSVQGADTDLAVLSSQNLGTGFNFVDDLGGEEDVSVPRIDGFYRFNRWHRIEFGSFQIQRDGRGRLSLDLDIGDQSYSVGDTVISDIQYRLLKLGYAYTFYHSPEVELSFTAGLHDTDYEFEYELVDGSSSDSSKSGGPLPMYGLRVAYAINPKWSLHYLAEVLFVEAGDAEGSFTNFELDLEYKLNKRIMLGAGLTRFSMDITSDDEDWNGRIADTHQGVLVFGGYYF